MVGATERFLEDEVFFFLSSSHEKFCKLLV